MTCTSSSPRFISSQALDSLSFVHPVVKDGKSCFLFLALLHNYRQFSSSRTVPNGILCGRFIDLWAVYIEWKVFGNVDKVAWLRSGLDKS